MQNQNSLFKKYLILFSFVPLILSIGIVPGLSFADYSDSPDAQIDDGFLPHEVACALDMKQIIRHNGKAACVFEHTAKEWSDKGIAVRDSLLQCTSDNIHLQNPGTDAIICRGPGEAQKFVDRGWVALDAPPPKKETKNDQCKGGEIHVQSPTLGTILCKTPTDAQKFIDAGWEALDELPTFTQTGKAECGPTRVAMSGDITGSVICVRSASVDFYKSHDYTLVEDEPKAGDPVMYEMTQCRGGTFHLQNPDSGIIMCTKQSSVPKYLERGWISLDELPFNVP